jgi:hypothetical protein
MQASPATKPRLLKQLIALLVFALVCGMLAVPVFSTNGYYSGRSKMALFVLVFGRLTWQIYRGTFRFRDYYIWFALVIAFCLWLDSYL